MESQVPPDAIDPLDHEEFAPGTAVFVQDPPPDLKRELLKCCRPMYNPTVQISCTSLASWPNATRTVLPGSPSALASCWCPTAACNPSTRRSRRSQRRSRRRCRGSPWPLDLATWTLFETGMETKATRQKHGMTSLL